MEVKKPYVQMPKPDNDEAVKLLANLVEVLSYSDRKQSQAYYDAVEYLERIAINETKKPQPRPPGGGEHLKIY